MRRSGQKFEIRFFALPRKLVIRNEALSHTKRDLGPMNRIVVSLEFDDMFDDMYGGTCRVLDLTRKMAFELERCVVNVVQAGTGRMHLRLADRLDDPTRRQALVHRLANIPTVRVVTAEEVSDELCDG